MKKMKMITCLIIVLVTILVFSTTAFAYVDVNTWRSTVCLYGFTTKNSIYSAGFTWEYFDVFPDYIHFATPVSDPFLYLYATPKSSTGLIMGPKTKIAINDSSVWGEDGVNYWIDCTKNRTADYVKFRIDNPHPGNNMESNGLFYGHVVEE